MEFMIRVSSLAGYAVKLKSIQSVIVLIFKNKKKISSWKTIKVKPCFFLPIIQYSLGPIKSTRSLLHFSYGLIWNLSNARSWFVSIFKNKKKNVILKKIKVKPCFFTNHSVFLRPVKLTRSWCNSHMD